MVKLCKWSLPAGKASCMLGGSSSSLKSAGQMTPQWRAAMTQATQQRARWGARAARGGRLPQQAAPAPQGVPLVLNVCSNFRRQPAQRSASHRGQREAAAQSGGLAQGAPKGERRSTEAAVAPACKPVELLTLLQPQLLWRARVVPRVWGAGRRRALGLPHVEQFDHSARLHYPAMPCGALARRLHCTGRARAPAGLVGWWARTVRCRAGCRPITRRWRCWEAAARRPGPGWGLAGVGGCVVSVRAAGTHQLGASRPVRPQFEAAGGTLAKYRGVARAVQGTCTQR